MDRMGDVVTSGRRTSSSADQARPDRARHQWGPAPSGTTQHQSICRRCGLREISAWYRLLGGRDVEVVTWVAPTGAVVGVRAVDSHQGPSKSDAIELLDDDLIESGARDPIAQCPGAPDGWGAETLES
jgi:hypothetical protein